MEGGGTACTPHQPRNGNGVAQLKISMVDGLRDRNRTGVSALQIADFDYPARPEFAGLACMVSRSFQRAPLPMGRVPQDSPETPFVPRLSLIVPFQRDESALETTLVSILESRSAADELIIVHAGNFDDPYELGRDEAVILETDHNTPIAEQLNLAARTACSPLLQVVLPGTTVEPGWADEPIDLLRNDSIHAVALACRDSESGQIEYGLDRSQMPHRRGAASPASVGGPSLDAMIVRRRSLLKLGGWSPAVSPGLMDLELSLLMQTLHLDFAVEQESRLSRHRCVSPMNTASFDLGKGCGQIACAYSEIEDSFVVIEPLVKRIGQLASGLIHPKLAAERLGWVLGVRDRTLVRSIAERVELARDSFAESISLPMELPERSTWDAARRAA